MAGNVRVLKCFSSANGWRGGLVDAMFSDFRELVFVAGVFLFNLRSEPDVFPVVFLRGRVLVLSVMRAF